MTDSHLVMLEEDGRNVMRRVSTSEYTALKAARSPTATATVAPAKADALRAPEGVVRAILGV